MRFHILLVNDRVRLVQLIHSELDEWLIAVKLVLIISDGLTRGRIRRFALLRLLRDSGHGAHLAQFQWLVLALCALGKIRHHEGAIRGSELTRKHLGSRAEYLVLDGRI